MTRHTGLGTYLKSLRGGLSQEQAGRKAGLPSPRETWNKLENGKVGLGPVNAARISEAFGRSYEGFCLRSVILPPCIRWMGVGRSSSERTRNLTNSNGK